MGSLSNLYISQSFQSLAHLGTDSALVPGTMSVLQDGIGQSLNISFDGTNISSSGNIYAANLVQSSITASSLITASVTNDDITFTKGDGSTFTIQVATGSFALSASFAETASIARNLVITARNGNASTLPIGTIVHITSAVGDNPIFDTASWDTELLSANTLGVLRQVATSGTDVEVVVQGKVTGVNTDPALGYAAGDVIYLSSSGQFTRVQPQAPNQIVVLGQVLRAQQNNGSIYVAINNGWELNELHNVQINNAQTGDLIQYESSSYGLWKNKSIQGAGITTTSSFNSYTSSTNTRLNSIEAKTGSYAITGSNTFYGTQIISGSGFTLFVHDSSSVNTTQIGGNISRFAQLYANTFFPRQIFSDFGNNIVFTLEPDGGTNGGTFVVNSISGSQFTGSVSISGSTNISGSIFFHGNSSIQPDAGTGNINVIGGPGGWAALQDSSASNWVWVDNTAVYIGTDQGGAAPTWTFGTDASLTTPGKVTVGDVLALTQLDPLPSGNDGELAVSASNLYFFSGSAWNRVAFA